MSSVMLVSFFKCNLDSLADWRVNVYKFLMTTLLKKTKSMTCRLFSRFQVDVSMYHDVITYYTHKIALFWVLVTWCASAFNEDELAGESRFTRFYCRQRVSHFCILI